MISIITRKWWNPQASVAEIEARGKYAALECAEFILERALVYVPVLSGELKGSLTIVSSSDMLMHWVIATAKHAEPVEFGYRHWISGRRIPPNPYMRKAVRDGANRFPQIIGEARVRQGYYRGAVMGAEIRAR